ncbi:hypothetical protein FHR83_009172 [Actinoplanes campanulatus]|uniref:Uncharacterized protein n=1 Tax=Actinoplanes campanulatus TaxID=113559 RepID=A0A7W5AS82_9ACTN|nr:hypothetical protein [Actinoplanes campanulatus]MBB3101443.1 hypothetical protein [Actinoplanes campanulatus]
MKRHWSAAWEYDFAAHGVCDDETYSRLPRLPEHLFTGDFGWLTADAAGADAACYMQPGAVPRLAMREVEHRLAREGLYLPPSFVTFMTDTALQQRVPSRTDDVWRMSDPAPSPFEEDGRLLEFMHDSQGNWYTYLYLAADGSCPVLGSYGMATPERGEEPEELPRESPVEYLGITFWMAPDFEQFLYRYWVDSVIWLHLVHQKRPTSELPPRALEYLTLLQDPDRPPLDTWPAPMTWARNNPNQLRLW